MALRDTDTQIAGTLEIEGLPRGSVIGGK